MRYFIELAYEGTLYHGWQIQPNAISVQQELTKVGCNYFNNQKFNVTGCGRTDTGVHAEEFYAHFDSETAIDVSKAVHNLNNMLPKDIAIKTIRKVDDLLHARFSAISRTYKYRLHYQKNPFIRWHSYRHYKNLDLDKMNTACGILLNHRDFTSFSKVNTGTHTNDCVITQACWEHSETGIVFTVQANRFLRNMVRAIVGTMIEIGEGKIEVEAFNDIINSKDRGNAGKSVPALGLSLFAVKYPNNNL
ncbi:MAG: tRNA pseudouridine(38-40) synthase TruA [Crocinitomicaceae bacterium]|jgi:tRNA pseudouridine38-40 synthase|nr:tRNA pseudouridine(38-40) synthase TruA [Crocinitomicaceae bacterium]MBT5401953.1 tRNA pseudouridine(38-40) synthase TruA [Crocinitomicaceae bacterium]MBT6513337.1 tRNA pseudouridine(38-40) synthase TruA [Crocinitomicaceae bacterium]